VREEVLKGSEAWRVTLPAQDIFSLSFILVAENGIDLEVLHSKMPRCPSFPFSFPSQCVSSASEYFSSVVYVLRLGHFFFFFFPELSLFFLLMSEETF